MLRRLRVARAIVLTMLLAVGLTISSLLASAPLFEVISEGDDHTEVEFNLSGYELKPVEVDGVKYNRLYHPEAGFLMEDMLPEVIHFSFFLSVPRTGAVSIEQPRIQETSKMDNFMLFPSQGADLDICDEKGFIIDNDFYQKDINYPETLVQLGRPGIMRDLRMVNVTLYPFVYNPARTELTVHERITVRINYDQSIRGEDELTGPERRVSRGFERVQRGLVLNYDQFRNPNLEYQPRSILMIRHHSDSIDGLMEQYAGWKRDKGFEVTVADTRNMTSDIAIRNYILHAYNNWQIPPEYVILIGDGGNGGLTIPFNSGQNDHYYSLLVGNNDFSDVFVGRISVPNANGLATIWNKIRNYERVPFMGNTDWYNHNTLIADLGSHGGTISPQFLMKHVKQFMLAYNPEKDITEIYGSGNMVTQMTTAMNRGGLFFWYRGSIGCSGWPPAETSMTNGFMMPHAHFVTCSTLDYQGGRQAEPTFRAGTPTTARGAITVIGFRGGARTGPGNLLTAGTLNGIYVTGIRNMGEALVYSKMNLWRVYGNAHSQHATSHSRSANLIGDPSMDIWLQTPRPMNVDYPETVPAGSNSVLITVTDADDNPLEGAWVTVRQVDDDGEEVYFETGYTGADGVSTRFFPTDLRGDLRVTVTKDYFIPHLGGFEITGNPAVSFHDIVTNDDILAGAQVDFAIVAGNHRDAAVNGLNGTIATDSRYVTITENSSAFGNIGSGNTGASISDYRIQISPATPANYRAIFTLTMTDGAQNSWVSRFMLTVLNANLQVTNLTVIDDGGNGVLDPLEEADLRYHIRNTGSFTVRNVRGRLLGDAFGITVLDSTAFYGDIAPNQTVSSTDNHFRLATSTYVIEGQRFNFRILLYNDEGFRQIHTVPIDIGTVSVTTPLGPDNYGYWIYDHGDVGYVDSPEYDWVEIAPGNEGFEGTRININSDFDNVQEYAVVELPFAFRYYGIDYEEITISVNGWISFGRAEQSEQRAWRIPGPLGPLAQIAAFWENLSPQGGIFTYYWEEQSQFIIQWENSLNVMGNAPNTFQIILYDPEAYYTTTFDGPIKIQYKVFNNTNNGANSPPGIGNWGTYATVGIRNHLDTDGLEYTSNNTYPRAARPITNETALYITTGLSSALVGIESYSFTGENANAPWYGETVDINMMLQNVGIEDAFDVSAVLSTEDQYVTVIQDYAEFGDMDVQESVNVNGAYTIEIADDVPHHHRAYFNLAVTAADGLFWTYDFSFRMQAPSLVSLSPFIHDPAPGGDNNGIVDPGEEVIMYLPIYNEGATTPPVNINVTSETNLASVTSIGEHILYSIQSNETQFAEVHLSISDQAITGTGLRFSYSFDSGNYNFEGQFLIGVGGIVPVRMGEGDEVGGPNDAGPLNIYYRSNRSQFVYTVEEFNAAGIYGEFPITQFGFHIHTAPANPLQDFKIRVAHTTRRDASAHISDSLTTVYRVNNYSPTPGDWDLLVFDPPFVWNGVDNLLVDTSFAPVSAWSSSGQIRIYEQINGYRYTRNDAPDQTNQPTNTVSNDKPQAMMMMGIDPLATANRPQNLTATSTATSIDLSWDPPLGNRADSNRRRRNSSDREDLSYRNTRYHVYRNGIRLTEEPVEATEYQDNNIEGYTRYHYYTTSVINDSESNPSNVVSIEADAVSKPQISPASGVYYEPFEVTITCETDESTIYYTLDGRVPTADDYLYEGPFMVDYHVEVRAIGVRDGWLDSREASATYHILYSPQHVRGTGTTNSVMLIWEEPWTPDRMEESSRRRTSYESQRSTQQVRTLYGYNVYRSTDNEEFEKLNDELLDDVQYTDERLERDIYYYYVTAVYELGESRESQVAKIGVGIVTRPTFDPEPGEYEGYVELRLRNTAGPAAVIYYTLNGEDPDETSQHYSPGSRILIESTTTVKAFAVRTDWQDSGIASGLFTILETTVDDEEMIPIANTELFAAYPNPFNPNTTISFNLRDNDRVTLEIYNLLGQKVKTLVQEHLPAGNHSFVWKGDSNSGKRVSSGIYFYRMQTSDYSSVRKIVMIK